MSGYSLYERYAAQLSKKYIKKTDLVFDCGCGDGAKTFILKNYSNNVIGGDLVDRVKKDFDINFREIDPTDYGQENEFDVVTSFDVIEHMEDDVGYLNELIRITRFGGLLIIGTPNKNRLSNKLTSMLKGNIEYPRCLGYHYESGGDIIHIREYTRESLIKLVSNFENLKILNFYSCFFGLYVFGKSLGFKNVNVKILKDYSQHLFIILKKVNISR